MAKRVPAIRRARKEREMRTREEGSEVRGLSPSFPSALFVSFSLTLSFSLSLFLSLEHANRTARAGGRNTHRTKRRGEWVDEMQASGAGRGKLAFGKGSEGSLAIIANVYTSWLSYRLSRTRVWIKSYSCRWIRSFFDISNSRKRFASPFLDIQRNIISFPFLSNFRLFF